MLLPLIILSLLLFGISHIAWRRKIRSGISPTGLYALVWGTIRLVHWADFMYCRPRDGTCEPCSSDTFTGIAIMTSLCESRMREDCTSGLSGGRRLTLRRASSDPTPKKTADIGSGRPYPAERLEGRGLAKGNSGEQTRFWTQGEVGLQHALDRICKAAKKGKGKRFTTLWRHVYNVNRLREAFYALKRQAAPGVDGETWKSYGQSLEENLNALSERLKRGAIHSQLARRHKYLANYSTLCQTNITGRNGGCSCWRATGQGITRCGSSRR